MPRFNLQPLKLAALVLAFSSAAAHAQLRICSWNVTNYNSNGTPPSNSRDVHFQTAFYGIIPDGLALADQSMSPDVIIGQEFITAASVLRFRDILNAAPGSPGDWAAAPFLDGPDTDSAFFYRTSKVQYLATWTVALGSSSSCNQPRHTRRYDFRPLGYTAPSATIAVYSVHLKAQGSNSACPEGENAEGRRLIECQRIRDNAAGIDTNPNWIPAIGGSNPPGSSGLPAGYCAIMAGDTNIQNSSRPDYQSLVGVGNPARFFDPINSPGTWNNSSAFRFIHTQDPATGGGGMDDRHDQLLLSATLIDRAGLDYIFTPAPGGTPPAFSTTTWNDPNHTYRAWGNDGTSFNLGLRTAGNTMVGQAIAEALVASAGGGGHLPVMADFRVPARIAAAAVIDFGSVPVGQVATANLEVGNAANVAIWNVAGIAALTYSMSGTAGFSAPAGSFTDAAGGGVNAHAISMDTGTPGPRSGTLTITSSDPDQPALVVTLIGEVVDVCRADFNGDGLVFPDDLSEFITCFFLEVQLPGFCPRADFNADGLVFPDDLSEFITAFFLSDC